MQKWGWLVLVGGLTLRQCIHSVMTSYGVFLVHFIGAFPTTPVAFLESIGAVSYGISAIGTPLSLFLYRKFKTRRVVFAGVFAAALGFAWTGTANDPRVIFFTYGIVLGIGGLLANNTPLFLITQYFKPESKYFVLVTSLPVPTAAFVLEPLFFFLGWKNGFAVLGIITFAFGTLAALAMRENESSDEAKSKESESERNNTQCIIDRNSVTRNDGLNDCEKSSITNREINDGTLQKTSVKTNTGGNDTICENGRGGTEESCPSKTLVFLISIVALTTLLFRGAVIHSLPFFMVKYLVQEFNSSPFISATTVTAFSICDLVGRFTVSFTGDRLIKGYMVEMCAVCGLLVGLMCLAAGYATQYYQMLIFNIGCGFVMGLISGSRYPSMSEALDHWYAKDLYSVSRVGAGVGAIIGNFVAGALYDATGSYRILFFVDLGLSFFVFVGFAAIVLIRKHLYRNKIAPLTKNIKNTENARKNLLTDHEKTDSMNCAKQESIPWLSRLKYNKVKHAEERIPLKELGPMLNYESSKN